MVRYVDAIDLPIPIEEAFDFLADFSRTAEWDPCVEEARRISRGDVGLGTRFEVVVSFLGQRFPLEYEITGFHRPSRLVLTGGDSSLKSVDEITFVSRSGGTRVTYEARLELVGIRRLAEPVLELLFQRVGRLAVRGLREHFADELLTESSKRSIEHSAPGRSLPETSRRSARSTRSVRSKHKSNQTKGVAS